MSRRLPYTYPMLLPLSWIYGSIVWWRNLLFDLNIIRSESFPIPVISIGNITVGGTGKTPHVEHIIRLLKTSCRIAVLSRGYKRKTKGFIMAGQSSGVEEIGDEPKQIKMKFPGVNVAVDKKRKRGIRFLMESGQPPDVIILDDAFQHRFVKPGLSILLIDYQRPISRDFLLPCGRLREHAGEKRRADIIVVTKCPGKMSAMDRRIMLNDIKPLPYQKTFFSTYRYGEPLAVFPDESQPVTKAMLKNDKTAIILLTGIANNRSLKKYIRGITPRFKELKFPDHHQYKTSDLQKLEHMFREMSDARKIILTTEKDAVRLKELKLANEIRQAMHYVPVEVDFLFGESEIFTRLILEYAGKNK